MDTTQTATNADVARRIGLNHSSVSRMRSGKRAASIQVIYGIARVYDVPPGPLLEAAAKFHQGDRELWTTLINDVFAREPVAT